MSDREKLLKLANRIVNEAKGNGRRIENITLGEVLVQQLTGDDLWEIDGANQSKRLYHLLHFIVKNEKFAA